MKFGYKRPLIYGKKARVDVTYRNTEAAKIIFDYEIADLADGLPVATGSSVQVFLDRQHQLVWTNPPFYEEWKQKWGLL